MCYLCCHHNQALKLNGQIVHLRFTQAYRFIRFWPLLPNVKTVMRGLESCSAQKEVSGEKCWFHDHLFAKHFFSSHPKLFKGVTCYHCYFSLSTMYKQPDSCRTNITVVLSSLHLHSISSLALFIFKISESVHERVCFASMCACVYVFVWVCRQLAGMHGTAKAKMAAKG